MEIVKIDNNQIRFSISYKNVNYKLFQYFSQPDCSLGFKSYLETNAEVSFRKQDTKPFTISIKERLKEAKTFEEAKTSFHKSGTICRKDKFGERMTEELDIRSIPFDKVDKNIALSIMFPTTINKYPVIDDQKEYNVFSLSDECLPPMIICYIFNNNFDQDSWLVDTKWDIQIFRDVESLSKFNLGIDIVMKNSGQDYFPNAQTIIDPHY